MPGKVISDHGPQFNRLEHFSVQRKLKDSTYVPFPHTTSIILKCMENHIKILKHTLNRNYRLRF